MEKRVEIFVNDDVMVLQRELNSFLKDTAGKLHDLKCSLTQSRIEGMFVETLAICLIYSPEEEHASNKVIRKQCL
jgi:hypothetical protein